MTHPQTQDDEALVRDAASSVDYSTAYKEARERMLEDMTNPLDICEHLVRVAAEHAARAALTALRNHEGRK